MPSWKSCCRRMLSSSRRRSNVGKEKYPSNIVINPGRDRAANKLAGKGPFRRSSLVGGKAGGKLKDIISRPLRSSRRD